MHVFMPVIARGPIAKGLSNSNPYLTLNLVNARTPLYRMGSRGVQQ